jgi:hypothetical protein
LNFKASSQKHLQQFRRKRNKNCNHPDNLLANLFRDKRKKKTQWHKHCNVSNQHMLNPTANGKAALYPLNNRWNKIKLAD